jgi:hypothetical protein
MLTLREAATGLFFELATLTALRRAEMNESVDRLKNSVEAPPSQ